MLTSHYYYYPIFLSPFQLIRCIWCAKCFVIPLSVWLTGLRMFGTCYSSILILLFLRLYPCILPFLLSLFNYIIHIHYHYLLAFAYAHTLQEDKNTHKDCHKSSITSGLWNRFSTKLSRQINSRGGATTYKLVNVTAGCNITNDLPEPLTITLYQTSSPPPPSPTRAISVNINNTGLPGSAYRTPASQMPSQEPRWA